MSDADGDGLSVALPAAESPRQTPVSRPARTVNFPRFGFGGPGESLNLPADVGRSANPIMRISQYQSAAKPVLGGDASRWLLVEGRAIDRDSELFDELNWRLIAKGLPLWRASLHIGTLHPQIVGFGCRWWRDTGITEEILIAHGVRDTQDYLLSPIRYVIEFGDTVRFNLGTDCDAVSRHPLLAELKAAGATGYAGFPLLLANGRHQAVTWSTDQPGGFSESDIDKLADVVPALGSVIEAKTMRRIARNLLDTYVGRQISSRILGGQIRRGQGEEMRAVLMSTDMRGFTRMSDQLPGDEIIGLLDDYFECIAEPVHEYGGEVLKFIGDGVLAIFPLDNQTEVEATGAALAAAREGLARLDEVNIRNRKIGRPDIRAGVGLHIGDIIYGNVGAMDRLDFTAIGPAVNVTSRLENLTKRFDRTILTSHEFAAACPTPLVSLGFQPLRGVAKPEEVFGLPGEGESNLLGGP